MIRRFSFHNAVLLSSMLHLLFLFGGSRFYSSQPIAMNKPPQDLEVSYARPIVNKDILMHTEIQMAPSGRLRVLSQDGTSSGEKKVNGNLSVTSKHQAIQDTISPERTVPDFQGGVLSEEVVIPELRLTHRERPLYLAYYQDIRERIRKSVQRRYPHGLQNGQVFLTFVLFSNGNLKEVAATEKSLQDQRLKEVAMRGVIDASPFPPFPEGLQRPFVPFRVMVTFVGDKS